MVEAGILATSAAVLRLCCAAVLTIRYGAESIALVELLGFIELLELIY